MSALFLTVTSGMVIAGNVKVSRVVSKGSSYNVQMVLKCVCYEVLRSCVA